MTVLGDIWDVLPDKVKFLAGLSIFLYAGSTILQAIIFLWNLFGVNGANAINGCLTGAKEACIPAQNGIFIFGINIVDYWTITFIIIFGALAIFAIQWYQLTFR